MADPEHVEEYLGYKIGARYIHTRCGVSVFGFSVTTPTGMRICSVAKGSEVAALDAARSMIDDFNAGAVPAQPGENDAR